MAVTYLNKNHKAVYAGLSTDEKPIKVGNGALFYEMDTGNIYMFDKQNKVWCIQANDGGGAGGTSDHSKLSNRDKADQHPISAITGLQEALDKGGGITVKDAKVGQLIRAKAVDETGNITEYEPVPFMYEEVSGKVTFPEQEVSGFTELNPEFIPGFYGLIGDTTNTPLTLGNKVIIRWDGTDYPCEVKEFKPSPDISIPYLGNMSLYPEAPPSVPDTGEPFVLTDLDGAIGWLTKEVGASHTIGVTAFSSIVHTIPNKYLEPHKVIFTFGEKGAATADKTFEEVLTWAESGYNINAYGLSETGEKHPLTFTDFKYDSLNQTTGLEFTSLVHKAVSSVAYKELAAMGVVYNADNTIETYPLRFGGGPN